MTEKENVFSDAKIKDDEFNKLLIRNYSTRPNQKSAYGPGLNATQTKDIFDAAAIHIKERHNKLIEHLKAIGPAESERIKAEQARVQNEEGRVGAEINRQVAELGAIGNYYDAEENAVKDAEGNVVNNTNAGRVGAEIERKKVTGDIGQALEKILETQNAYLHDEVPGTLEEKLNYITTQLTKLDGAVDELKAELGAGGTDGENTFLRAHPVGSIYICVGSKDDTEEIIATKSPQSLFGGTWERIKDRFLLAAGDNYAAGTEGGEDAVTLTAEQLPPHQHYIGAQLLSGKVYARNNLTKGDAESGLPYITRLDSESGRYEEPENEQGKLVVTDKEQTRGSAHNNMPPYFAVYMWKRVQ